MEQAIILWIFLTLDGPRPDAYITSVGPRLYVTKDECVKENPRVDPEADKNYWTACREVFVSADTLAKIGK